MSHSRRASLVPPLRLDGEPRRPVSSVNLRFEDKRVFDLLHSWWVMRGGSGLSQPEAFAILLRLALANPEADLPEELVR